MIKFEKNGIEQAAVRRDEVSTGDTKLKTPAHNGCIW